MADNNFLPHIKIEGFSSSLTYIYPYDRKSDFKSKNQNRRVHGHRLLERIERIRSQFENLKDITDFPEDAIKDNVVYVDFYSEYDFRLVFDSLDSDDKRKLKAKLLNVRPESIEQNGEVLTRYRVTVMLTQGGVSDFLKKINKYLNENTKDKEGNITDKPKHKDLIDNIEDIQLATLKSFWAESDDHPFPDEDEEVWWEVWFRKENEGIDKVERQVRAFNIELGQRELTFPEHQVRLIKGSPRQLSQSLMLLDNLAELRKPQELADFFLNEEYQEQGEWVDDLRKRTTSNINPSSQSICIIDTGVQNQHPLLVDFLPDHHLYTLYPSWGTGDDDPNGGHGTGMAGLALYGDLTPILSSSEEIEVDHQLESFKILKSNGSSNPPELYGDITIEACGTPQIDFPERNRVYCLTICDQERSLWGRPSSWSAAIDMLINQDKQLILISGGNVTGLNHPDQYPSENKTQSVHDPGQAFNAITVGGYTEFDRIDQDQYPGYYPLANGGGLAPSSTTSLNWDGQWPNKPDIVMEAGNFAYNERLDFAGTHESLQLLTTHKDYRTTYFQFFGDTSGATALASKIAAELQNEYPDLWVETIRGLLIHSAFWNDTMLGGNRISNLRQNDKINLLRTFGYGVPNLEHAKYSATNSLTLIAERELTPFQYEGSVKYNEYHLFELPWPKEVLEQYPEQEITLKVTLSYYIEPNPGSKSEIKRYSNKFSYQSHALGFSVIGRNEDEATFKKRISKTTREEHESGFQGERWTLGPNIREKGSIHKDLITMTGAEMSERNKVVVYPKGGWHKTRKALEKYNESVRYSLIITLETHETNIDLYNPVLNQIPIET